VICDLTTGAEGDAGLVYFSLVEFIAEAIVIVIFATGYCRRAPTAASRHCQCWSRHHSHDGYNTNGLHVHDSEIAEVCRPQKLTCRTKNQVGDFDVTIFP
jgi:hypothetical protein